MDAVDEAIDKLLADRRRLLDECDKLTTERDKLNGLLIRLYNDLFVHHSGTAVADI